MTRVTRYRSWASLAWSKATGARAGANPRGRSVPRGGGSFAGSRLAACRLGAVDALRTPLPPAHAPRRRRRRRLLAPLGGPVRRTTASGYASSVSHPARRRARGGLVAGAGHRALLDRRGRAFGASQDPRQPRWGWPGRCALLGGGGASPSVHLPGPAPCRTGSEAPRRARSSSPRRSRLGARPRSARQRGHAAGGDRGGRDRGGPSLDALDKLDPGGRQGQDRSSSTW